LPPAIPLNRLTVPLHKLLGLDAEAKLVGAERAALVAFANRYALGRK
jgi:hypothetical protein